jgi:valyl-tRNA synthetase
MASPGTDIAFNVARTEGYRAFANKIWNAARFIFMNVDRAAEVGITVDPAVLGGMPYDSPDDTLEARWIVAELHAAATEVNRSLESYRYDDAANAIYKFFWGSFCDWYLEIVKLRLDFSETADRTRTKAALTTLVTVFEAALRLLSPFMPFITEELWHAAYDDHPLPAKSIALTNYPQGDLKYQMESYSEFAQSVALDFLDVSRLITEIRALRKEVGVEERAATPVELRIAAERHPVVDANVAIIESLARVSDLRLVEDISAGLPKRHTPSFDVAVVYERTIDLPAERDRLTKECLRLEKIVANDERALNDPGFAGKAPAHIVEGRKKQLAENRLLLEKAKAALDGLPKG